MDTQADGEQLRGSLLPETGPYTPELTANVSQPDNGTPPAQLGVYRLLEKLGHGGMGTVYKAWHCRLKRLAALKVPLLDCILDGPALARFHREMELIGRLDHPNIVRATDAGEAEGIPYLVMELLDGLDLRRLRQLLGPLPAPEVCAIAYQTLLGLECLRENGLVHRDIKPSNLMLTPAGEVKILDLGLGRFGEAKRGEELTATGLTMGTADYMAPEQRVDAHRVDIRADIYSLGCTMYKLLTGKSPSESGESGAAPSNIEGLAVSAELAEVLRRLLAADKAGRYATPAEAAEALRPFADGADLVGLLARVGNVALQRQMTPRPLQGKSRSTQLKPPTVFPEAEPAPAPASGRGRRRIVGAAAAALFLIVLAGSLLLGIYLRRDTPNNAAERRAAEWVLSKGGAVEVLLPGKADAEPINLPLPDVPFCVVNVTLEPSNVEDDDLKNLQDLAKLRLLSLHRADKITDKGLAYIGSLTTLQVLDLYHTKITDAGMEHVERLQQLQRLSVHETALTDAGLSHLANLKELTALNLSGTRVSDRGLVHLAGLAKLGWLQLRNTAVTDEGLRHLRGLTALHELYLDSDKISEKAAADLKTSLPYCKISR
jgi:hypothetical protein